MKVFPGVVALVLFTSISVFSADFPKLNFKTLTTKNGLVSNGIISIHQDKDGFIWFGGFGNLNKYDGRKVQTYQLLADDTTVLAVDIFCDILEDSQGILWISTYYNGIALFDKSNETVTRLKHDPDNPGSLSNNNVVDVFEDVDKNIWVVMEGGGMSMYQRSTGTFVHYRHDPANPESIASDYISPIASDSKGNLWTCTKDGVLFMFDIKKRSIENTHYTVSIGTQSTHFYRPKIFIDSEDNILIGSSNGLCHIDRQTDKISYINHFNKMNRAVMNITSIIEIDKETYLVSTENEGLFIYNRLTNEYVSYSNKPDADYPLTTNAFSTMYQSHEGIIWIGTYQEGIKIYDRYNIQIHLLTDFVEKSSVQQIRYPTRSLCASPDSNIWIANQGGGLIIYNPRDHSIKNITSEIQSLNIYALYASKEANRIWIGTQYDGLFCYDLKTKHVVHYIHDNKKSNSLASNAISDIIEDDDQQLWIGYQDSGIDILNIRTNEITHYENKPDNPYSLTSNGITKLFKDSNGTIWVGTNKGLQIFYADNNSFITSPIFGSKELEGAIIYDIFEDSLGNIWIGTDLALNLLNKHDMSFMHIAIGDTLIHANAIFSIQEDHNGYIWVSTLDNLHKVHPVTKAVISYNVTEGLTGPGFIRKSSAALYNDLYFGSAQGVFIFNPEDVVDNINVRPVFLTAFSINYDPVELNSKESVLTRHINYTKDIKLHYKQSTFSLEFTSLEYSDPEKIQYRYMLEGFDDDWINAGNDNRAVYTKVKPGSYIFKVMASNNQGTWQGYKGTQVSVVITPPFWRTLWFRIVAAVLVLSLVAYLYYTRNQAVTRQRKILEEKVAERTKQLNWANTSLSEQQEELKQQQDELKRQNELLSEMSEKIMAQNKELEMHYDELEKLVEERTAELEQAKNKAEESDRLKSAFLANMSHEIRTPMNAIVGFTNLLKEGNLSDQEKIEYSDIITSNSDILLVLIDDILDLSLIEANQMPIKKEVFNLNEFLDHLYSAFSLMNSKEDIDIKLNNELYDLDLRIYSDKTRIKQIITNLMSNALKFTEKGFVELGLKKQDGHLSVYVKDTGIGIDKKELKVIFERFRKIDYDNSVLYRGTGLGLAISKALAKLLDGSLTVDSAKEMGSVFSLLLPESVISEEEPEIKEIPVQTNLQNQENKDVLIVEDEKANYLYIRRMLGEIDVKAHWAENGLEAVKFITSGMQFHMILMDIKMPEMNGFEATKIIKSKNPGQIIIAITAYARPEDRKRFMEAGFDDYITKPVKPDEFRDMIRKFIES